MATDPTKMFESDSDWDKVYDFDKVSLQKKNGVYWVGVSEAVKSYRKHSRWWTFTVRIK